MTDRPFTVIRGGAVLDRGAPRPRAADILIAGGMIRDIGPPGLDAPEEAREIAAHHRLLLPGLVNAHTHSHYTLAKGVAGNWTLEMLLNAGPWVIGGRAREDLRLGAVLGAAEVLDMATTGSARVLGFERIGRLEPDRAADIVFLDLRDLNYVPLNDARNQVVYCENGAAVDSVMIGGSMVYDRGRFTTIDYDRLVERANARAAELTEANAGLRREMDAVADVVGAFCVGLAREPYHVHRYVGDHAGGPESELDAR